MNKYQALCISREDRLFAERYVIQASSAKQAFQRALVDHFQRSGASPTPKAALAKAKDCLWSCHRCTSSTEPVWSGEDDMHVWVITKLGRPAR